MMMKSIECSLYQANLFVTQNHRHHGAVVGHKTTIRGEKNGKTFGYAIMGRPVARNADDGLTIEVTRLCTDGTKNGCSFLYSECAKIARKRGYKKIQTYTLESEPGTSLIAAGWLLDGVTKPGTWTRTKRPSKSTHPTTAKKRWVKILW